MRKILTSVLSVAGLLAVVLALASSPASAAKQVVTIESPEIGGGDPTNVGTYTVSWETQGGCDPGSGTSGASGSVTITVADDGTADDGDGTQQETGVVIDNICNYSWSASHVDADGADCRVTDFQTPAADADVTLALPENGCATTAKFHVTVAGNNATEDVFCTQTDLDDDVAGCDGADDGLETVKTAAAPNERDAGAVKNTTFTVTATAEKNTRGVVPEGCNAVSEDTEIDFDTGEQDATLTVVDRSLGGAECSYTVTAALPGGFAPGDGSARNTANSQKEQSPGDDAADGGPDGDDQTTDDNNDVTVDDLTVSVAAVTVYLVQNVIGDAGGASASYKLSTPCGAPGLPGALTARSASGGISTTDAVVVVELRTGRFNVSAGLTADATADGVERHALDKAGDACEATVAISGVPDGCSADGASASLDSSTGSVILEITVDCTPPAAPVEPDPPADTGDMGGDDDTGDMGGDDTGDMGGDDTGDMGGDDDDDDTGDLEDDEDTGGMGERLGTG